MMQSTVQRRYLGPPIGNSESPRSYAAFSSQQHCDRIGRAGF